MQCRYMALHDLHLTDAAPIAAARVAHAKRPPQLGRALVVGVAVVTLVMFIGVALGMWLLTGEPIDGLAVGAFTAFWGGPGFGVMAGSATFAVLEARHARHP